MSSIIELKDITKRFPGIVANDHISIKIEKGEIHAIAGENGAGKSTLMNIIFGLYKPDEGQIYIDGNAVNFSSSKDSINSKIGMVHQHFMLVHKLTVTENIIIGQEMGSRLKVDRKTAECKIQELSNQYGLRVDASKKVSELSVTEQQRVEILKVLYREAELLIFDEPTAVLTPSEIDEFCDILLKLRKAGKTIIFITHKLIEIMNVADRCTVIRHGKVTGSLNISEDVTADVLTRMMIGRSADFGRQKRKELPNTETILEIKDLHYTVNKTIKKLNGVNFELKSGEVLGVAGVDGNGQEELVKVICGLLKPESGEILLKGKNIIKNSVCDRKEMGIGLIPEDRHREGLVLDYSIADNLILGQHFHKEFAKKGRWLKSKDIHEHAEKMRDEFDIRSANVDVAAGTLSGGNQQKIVIAREVFNNPEVLIAVQPTRGLDIGAVEFVQQTLIKQRDKGKGILFFSLELDEIFAVSDRIAVIFKGRIVAIVDATKVTRQELGLLMLGSRIKTEGGEIGD